ncbi:MAG TPA: hypothetical protein VHG92_14665 [Afifellaceae bacterium]|nr:hypothetical protein [Afifellaceae bacterium]
MSYPRLGGRGVLAAWPLVMALTALAACTATTASPGPQRAQLAAAAGETASLPAPVRLAEARVAFAPLVGPPPAIADRLADAVGRQSAAHGLTLAPFGDAQAHYTVKGYLSAETAGEGTRAVYVWDVLDRDLKRLHRVTGEAVSPVTAAGPWAAIDGGTIEELARRSIGALAAWMGAG